MKLFVQKVHGKIISRTIDSTRNECSQIPSSKKSGLHTSLIDKLQQTNLIEFELHHFPSKETQVYDEV